MELREAKEGKREDQMFYMGMFFAAGTALLTVCLKIRLAELWRAWVFLALNVILLGIVFTSAPSSSKENGVGTTEDNASTETEAKRRKEQTGQATEPEEEWHDCSYEFRESEERKDLEDKGEDDGALPQMSKEELNERVETFIAMFRQHLIIDAKNSR